MSNYQPDEPAASSPLRTGRDGRFFRGKFIAMASDCEVLVETVDDALGKQIATIALTEAIRIQDKFSRYRDDNQIHRINQRAGQAVRVDDELARLLDFADHCYRLSDGLFDITAGVFRQVWRFDGSDQLPSRKRVKALLPRVGWQKVQWRRPMLSLQPGMEIDLGGIGKEYAVDQSIALITQKTTLPVMINFGGDLRATRPPTSQAWRVGVETASAGHDVDRVLELKNGALTTSGDARKYLERNGKRYGHVLNPRTGWPVSGAPKSVTVYGRTCTETGLLSTLAMLHGADAEAFLDSQQVQYWVQR